MPEKVTPEQRFDYIASRIKRHAEDIKMGAEELSSILISIAAQLLAKTPVKLPDVVATFLNDYLALKYPPPTLPVSLVPLVKPFALRDPRIHEDIALDAQRQE